ncbi:hypothetical protein ACGFWI_00995 [Streptomyces sp. NPDC048434]|uniref:hypothetical protein n=1 Tax=Streptomyces sp. NPDC048434 TaxID=3365549 RepID=UPI00371C0C0E
MSGTFDGYHQRRTDTGRARTRREALDAATYDQAAAPAAAGCLIMLALLVATIATALGVTLG